MTNLAAETLQAKNQLYFEYQDLCKEKLSEGEYDRRWYDLLDYFCANWEHAVLKEYNGMNVFLEAVKKLEVVTKEQEEKRAPKKMSYYRKKKLGLVKSRKKRGSKDVK